MQQILESNSCCFHFDEPNFPLPQSALFEKLKNKMSLPVNKNPKHLLELDEKNQARTYQVNTFDFYNPLKFEKTFVAKDSTVQTIFVENKHNKILFQISRTSIHWIDLNSGKETHRITDRSAESIVLWGKDHFICSFDLEFNFTPLNTVEYDPPSVGVFSLKTGELVKNFDSSFLLRKMFVIESKNQLVGCCIESIILYDLNSGKIIEKEDLGATIFSSSPIQRKHVCDNIIPRWHVLCNNTCLVQ